MRVLVAPDGFGGTLSAPEAARAVAEGWQRSARHDQVSTLPLSDGGPGFVDTLHAAIGGRVEAATVRGPSGEAVPISVLIDGETAYVESAQACGLHLSAKPAALHASSYGVGEAVAVAVDDGARRVVIGLGGSGTNDGGAGLLAALGAVADVPLDAGPLELRGATRVDLTPAHERLAGVEVVAASDVDSPLLGMFGATKTFGPQKGLTDEQIITVDALLDDFVVACCGSTPAERRVADAPGAGAAGGLGFALLLLGAAREPGVDVVAAAVGLDAACREADLVVSGEGRYDHTSRSGKVVHGVASRAAAAARPCIVLAGEVTVGSREMRAMGVESAYGLTELIGAERAFGEPDRALADLAERVARTWSPA